MYEGATTQGVSRGGAQAAQEASAHGVIQYP